MRAVNQWLIMPHIPEVVVAGERACEEAGSYVRGTVARQMKEPSPNLLGHVISALQTDWDASYEECEKATIILVHASHMVLAWTLTATLVAPLLHPASLTRVREDPQRVGPAIEEALRWASPFPGVFRQVAHDTMLSGVELSAGSVLFLSTAATHYDETVYPDPETFDLDRDPNHPGVRVGPHFCIVRAPRPVGGRIGLSMLVERCPNLRLDPGERLSFHHNVLDSALVGAERVPVLLD